MSGLGRGGRRKSRCLDEWRDRMVRGEGLTFFSIFSFIFLKHSLFLQYAIDEQRILLVLALYKL